MVDGKAAGLVLAGIGAVAFFGLDGVGKIRDAFADNSQSAQAVTPVVGNSGNTESIELETKNDQDDGKTNNIIIVESPEGQTQKQQREQSKNDVLILTPPKRITSERPELPKSTQAPQVRKPSFLSREEKSNPIAFNQRKFGINEKKLQTAVSKSSSKRSIEERKAIEAEKARRQFDSRSITNF